MSNVTSGVLIQTNGTLYTGGDVKVIYNGHLLTGIDAIKYGSKQEKKNVMGMSREPIGRILGGIEYSASITMKAFEVDALEVAVGGGIEGCQPTDIPVVYFDPLAAIVKTDILQYAEFTGNTREVKGPGDEIVIECELTIGGILRNV